MRAMIPPEVCCRYSRPSWARRTVNKFRAIAVDLLPLSRRRVRTTQRVTLDQDIAMKDENFSHAAAVRPVSPFLAAFIEMMVPGCPDGHKPKVDQAFGRKLPPQG